MSSTNKSPSFQLLTNKRANSSQLTTKRTIINKWSDDDDEEQKHQPLSKINLNAFTASNNSSTASNEVQDAKVESPSREQKELQKQSSISIVERTQQLYKKQSSCLIKSTPIVAKVFQDAAIAEELENQRVMNQYLFTENKKKMHYNIEKSSSKTSTAKDDPYFSIQSNAMKKPEEL